jgi:hypothetical protein
MLKDVLLLSIWAMVLVMLGQIAEMKIVNQENHHLLYEMNKKLDKLEKL